MILLNDLMNPSHLTSVRGIIFDCDGVLINSYKANVWYYNSFRERFGLEPMTPEEAHFSHTHNVFESLKRILPKENYDEALRHRADFDYRDVIPYLEREPDLMELLEWLRSAGVLMAVNTSRTDTMDLVNDAMGFGDYFSPVVTSMVVSSPKPHPEGVHMIADAWRMNLSKIVFVGDSSVDLKTARAAGVRFWSYKDKTLDCDLYIPGFQELRACMQRAWRTCGFL